MSSDFEISRDNCISIINIMSVFSFFLFDICKISVYCCIFLLLIAPVFSDFLVYTLESVHLS